LFKKWKFTKKHCTTQYLKYTRSPMLGKSIPTQTDKRPKRCFDALTVKIREKNALELVHSTNRRNKRV